LYVGYFYAKTKYFFLLKSNWTVCQKLETSYLDIFRSIMTWLSVRVRDFPLSSCMYLGPTLAPNYNALQRLFDVGIDVWVDISQWELIVISTLIETANSSKFETPSSCLGFSKYISKLGFFVNKIQFTVSLTSLLHFLLKSIFVINNNICHFFLFLYHFLSSKNVM